MELRKKKRGRPAKYDFSGLKPGERVRLHGRAVRKNPNAYISYWNKNNPSMKVSVLYDGDNNPYAELV